MFEAIPSLIILLVDAMCRDGADSCIISFIHHVRKLFPTSVDQPGPVLVHCSAGIGRSGTFITLDMMMQQMKDAATLSVCQCVRYLRTEDSPE